MRLLRFAFGTSLKWSIIGIISSLVAAFGAALLPFALGSIVDRLASARPIGAEEELELLGVVLLALAIPTAVQITTACATVIKDLLIQRVVLQIAETPARSVRLSVVESTEVATLAARADAEAWKIVGGYLAITRAVPRQVSVLIASAIGLAHILVWWTPLALSASLLINAFWLRHSVGYQLRAWDGAKLSTRHSKYALDTGLSIQSESEVGHLSIGNFLETRFRNHTAASMAPYWRKRRRYALAQGLIALVRSAAAGVVILYAVRALQLGSVSAGEFVTAVTLTLSLVSIELWGLAQVVEGGARIRALDRLTDVAKSFESDRQDSKEASFGPTVMKTRTPAQTHLPARRIAPRVVFENVWFRYANEHPWAIRDCSFELRRGDWTGIAGANGSGKSTVTKLIAGGYLPTKGRVLVNDRDLATFNDAELKMWQRSLLFVSQSILRLPCSTSENIELDVDRRSLDDHTIDRLYRASELAAIEIKQTPHHQPIELRVPIATPRLSGGEWQKVALARIAYQVGPSSLVLLDEPTSALDPLIEVDLLKAYRSLLEENTTILISHKMSLLSDCANILVIEDGEVIEEGSPMMLRSRGGRFSELEDLQSDDY